MLIRRFCLSIYQFLDWSICAVAQQGQLCTKKQYLLPYPKKGLVNMGHQPQSYCVEPRTCQILQGLTYTQAAGVPLLPHPARWRVVAQQTNLSSKLHVTWEILRAKAPIISRTSHYEKKHLGSWFVRRLELLRAHPHKRHFPRYKTTWHRSDRS